jgi:hypothetical protein
MEPVAGRVVELSIRHGFSDGVEVATGSDPLNPASTPFTGRVRGSAYDTAFSVANSGSIQIPSGEVDAMFSVSNSSGNSAGAPNEIDASFSALNVASTTGLSVHETDGQFLVQNGSSASALSATAASPRQQRATPSAPAATPSNSDVPKLPLARYSRCRRKTT